MHMSVYVMNNNLFYLFMLFFYFLKRRRHLPDDFTNDDAYPSETDAKSDRIQISKTYFESNRIQTRPVKNLDRILKIKF